mgnify:CR=1 FL=1
MLACFPALPVLSALAHSRRCMLLYSPALPVLPCCCTPGAPRGRKAPALPCCCTPSVLPALTASAFPCCCFPAPLRFCGAHTLRALLHSPGTLTRGRKAPGAPALSHSPVLLWCAHSRCFPRGQVFRGAAFGALPALLHPPRYFARARSPRAPCSPCFCGGGALLHSPGTPRAQGSRCAAVARLLPRRSPGAAAVSRRSSCAVSGSLPYSARKSFDALLWRAVLPRSLPALYFPGSSALSRAFRCCAPRAPCCCTLPGTPRALLFPARALSRCCTLPALPGAHVTARRALLPPPGAACCCTPPVLRALLLYSRRFPRCCCTPGALLARSHSLALLPQHTIPARCCVPCALLALPHTLPALLHSLVAPGTLTRAQGSPGALLSCCKARAAPGAACCCTPSVLPARCCTFGALPALPRAAVLSALSRRSRALLSFPVLSRAVALPVLFPVLSRTPRAQGSRRSPAHSRRCCFPVPGAFPRGRKASGASILPALSAAVLPVLPVLSWRVCSVLQGARSLIVPRSLGALLPCSPRAPGALPPPALLHSPGAPRAQGSPALSLSAWAQGLRCSLLLHTWVIPRRCCYCSPRAAVSRFSHARARRTLALLFVLFMTPFRWITCT